MTKKFLLVFIIAFLLSACSATPAPNAPVPADIKEHAAGGSLRLRNGIADILFRVSRRIKSLNRNICRMGG